MMSSLPSDEDCFNCVSECHKRTSQIVWNAIWVVQFRTGVTSTGGRLCIFWEIIITTIIKIRKGKS